MQSTQRVKIVLHRLAIGILLAAILALLIIVFFSSASFADDSAMLFGDTTNRWLVLGSGPIIAAFSGWYLWFPRASRKIAIPFSIVGVWVFGLLVYVTQGERSAIQMLFTVFVSGQYLLCITVASTVFNVMDLLAIENEKDAQ